MTSVVLTVQVAVDIDRVFEFLSIHSPETASQRTEHIVNAINILRSSPGIGRPVPGGRRELVISTGGGYLALYEFNPMTDVVRVMSIKSQRENNYKWKSQ
jgi:plasmid stabilization system protein ParE